VLAGEVQVGVGDLVLAQVVRGQGEVDGVLTGVEVEDGSGPAADAAVEEPFDPEPAPLGAGNELDGGGARVFGRDAFYVAFDLPQSPRRERCLGDPVGDCTI